MENRFMELQHKQQIRDDVHALYVKAGATSARATLIADMTVHAVEQARNRLWEICDLAPDDTIAVTVSTAATQLLIAVLQHDMAAMLNVAQDWGITVLHVSTQEAGQ